MSKYLGLSSLVVVAVVSTIAWHASAVELHWQAPQECPSGTVVAEDIARLAGANEGRDLVATVVIARSPDERWRVVIELSGAATGHRELTADNCPQLSRAAALIVALAANPEAALDLPTEEPLAKLPPTKNATTEVNAPYVPDATESRSPGPPKTVLEVPPPVSSTRTSDSKIPVSVLEGAHPPQFWILAGLGYDRQSLPSPTEFLRLGLRVRQHRLGGAITADVTRSGRSEFIRSVGARFRSVGTQLVGCVEPFPLPFRAALCIGPRLEVLYVNGFGTSRDYDAWVLRPAGVFSTPFAYDISSRFSLGLSGELLVFGRRPKFVVENVDTLLYQPATLGFRLALEFAVRP